jgi:MYXO-CTERM domain-containing protein
MPVRPDRPTHETQLSPETRERLTAQHAEAIQRMTAAEAMTLAEMRQAIQDANDRLLAQTVEHADEPEAAQAAGRAAIRRIQGQLRMDFSRATSRSRRRARELSQGQVASELGAVQAWLDRAGSRERVPDPERTEGDAAQEDLDAIQSESAADSMSAAWALLALGVLFRWRRRGSRKRELAPALRGLKVGADGRIRRHAAWQAVDAYEVEHAAAWPSLVGPRAVRLPPAVRPLPRYPGLPLAIRRELRRAELEAEAEVRRILIPEPPVALPHGWRSGVMDVWSAILDGKTCPICSGLDGEMVPHGKPFPGGYKPAVHAHCRCVVITAFIPEAVAARLTSREAEKAVKSEIRDHFRGAKLEELELRRAEGMIKGSGTAVSRQMGGAYRQARERRRAPPLIGHVTRGGR